MKDLIFVLLVYLPNTTIILFKRFQYTKLTKLSVTLGHQHCNYNLGWMKVSDRNPKTIISNIWTSRLNDCQIQNVFKYTYEIIIDTSTVS
jgi:hypothetical protein